MSIKSFFSLVLYLGAYTIPSYVLLRKLGVELFLWKRSVLFGCAVGAMQIFTPVALVFISLELANSLDGAIIGSLLAPVLSYWYISRVLVVKWYQNIAIVFFLPFVAGFIAAPVLYLYYVAIA